MVHTLRSIESSAMLSGGADVLVCIRIGARCLRLCIFTPAIP